MTDLPSDHAIPPRLLEIRRVPVALDTDLANLFGVEVRRLNEQMRRNPTKFDDFAFQLTAAEFSNLMSQFATSSSGHGGRRKPPLVFTEHGVVLAAQQYLERGGVEDLLSVLKDLESA